MKQAFLNWKRAVASSMVLAALIVVSAGQAPAVEPKGELKSKEVKALVANAKTPADHMKLARHYTAMAAKHDAEAPRARGARGRVHAESEDGFHKDSDVAEFGRALQVLCRALPQGRKGNAGHGRRARGDGQESHEVKRSGKGGGVLIWNLPPAS